MKFPRWIIGLMAAMLMLSACSFGSFPIVQAPPTDTPTPVPTDTPVPTPTPTNTPTPTPTLTPEPSPTPSPTEPAVLTGAACLVGTWKLVGFDGILFEGTPSPADPESKVQFEDASGEAFYTFTEDGQVFIDANQFESNFLVKEDPLTLPLQIEMDGEAQAEYIIHEGDPNLIEVNNVEDEDLAFHATLSDVPFIGERELMDRAPLFNQEDESAPGDSSQSEEEQNRAAFACENDTLRFALAELPDEVQPLVLWRVEVQE